MGVASKDQSEVELNKNYAIIVTTNGGLWRYKIGDTIRFTSLSPYRIRVSGRTKHHINVFGEELIIENAEEALRKASQQIPKMITCKFHKNKTPYLLYLQFLLTTSHS